MPELINNGENVAFEAREGGFPCRRSIVLLWPRVLRGVAIVSSDLTVISFAELIQIEPLRSGFTLAAFC